MPHTTEWRVRVFLFEEEAREPVVKAHAVLETGSGTVRGSGIARSAPAVAEIPEIGDELAAGRALAGLARQLLDMAARDIEATTGEPVDHLR